ncbi:MAG: hypothetical protein WAL25_03300, partial [Acidimicrobiia bacterium]
MHLTTTGTIDGGGFDGDSVAEAGKGRSDMRIIDLTEDGESRDISVALFARFAPSQSGSVSAAKMLAEHLDRSFGMSVDVIRLVMPGEPSAGAHPVVMDLNPHWHMSAHLAAQRANDCDIAVILLDRHVPPELITEFISELTVPVVLWVDDVGPVGSP